MGLEDIPEYTPEELVKTVRAMPLPAGTTIEIEDSEKYCNSRPQYDIVCRVKSDLQDKRKYELKLFKYKITEDKLKKKQFISFKIKTINGADIEVVGTDENKNIIFTSLNSVFYSANSDNEQDKEVTQYASEAIDAIFEDINRKIPGLINLICKSEIKERRLQNLSELL
jgi:hypothetical protein